MSTALNTHHAGSDIAAKVQLLKEDGSPLTAAEYTDISIIVICQSDCQEIHEESSLDVDDEGCIIFVVPGECTEDICIDDQLQLCIFITYPDPSGSGNQLMVEQKCELVQIKA